MKSGKRFLALMLVLLLVFGCLGTAAMAAPAEIPEDGGAAGGGTGSDRAYSLTEEVVIQEDETPLGAAPTEADCCILHFVLMLCALGVTVYYVCDRKHHQTIEFELRSALM